MTALDAGTYEPEISELIIVKSRISPDAWRRRVERALAEVPDLERIAARVANGALLDAAIAREVPRSRRSWALRHWQRFRQLGWVALIDRRLPREPKLPKEGRALIEAARQANPKITFEEMLKILSDHRVNPLPSVSTIQRLFSLVDRRLRRNRKTTSEPKQVIEMEFAGGELLLAAAIETGAIGALTDVVQDIAHEARESSVGLDPKPDSAHRDSEGRFTAEYNERRARKAGEDTASYLRPAEEKAKDKVLSSLRFVHERRSTIEAKVKTLVFEPLVASTQGWEALRAAEAEALGTLTGFPYMPSTLSKFASALALANAGPRLLEAAGSNWHGIADKRWGESGAIAALYVDNHAKEVWTSLFTMSGKVASLNRVMPCITTTYIHTGAGTPLVASVQSGSAPLAPRLLQLVKNAEKVLGDSVKRATVVDAEGSVFDVLDAFSREGRIIVTPLRPARAPELVLTYGPGSYYRPYRENDELRIAQATLLHRSTGRELQVQALLVRRSHRESETVLLATGAEHGIQGRDLADLYFSRWPLQENWFKDGAVVALDRHRGNSSRMVANVVIVSEIETLEPQIATLTKDVVEGREAEREEQAALAAAARDAGQDAAQVKAHRKYADAMLRAGKANGDAFSKNAIELHRALAQADSSSTQLRKAQERLDKIQSRLAAKGALLEKKKQRLAKISPQARIRQVDVALDSILTATKLTCLLLISFTLREYMTSIAITPQTFVARVFGLRGRREIRENEEQVLIYANPRDPVVTDAMREACVCLNNRGLMREGRRIRYAVVEKEDLNT